MFNPSAVIVSSLGASKAATVSLAFLLGYVFFGELPTIFVFIGAAIIAGAGLFVLLRERQLGLKRMRAAEGPPTGG